MSDSRLHADQSTDSTAGRSPTLMPKSKIDDLGFLEITPGIDPVVDIVAIHGLQGHREKTWTTDDGHLWLRDLLPVDIPNARILAYGYDADTRSRECVSTNTMYLHAKGLAQALSRARKDHPRRPIIFVAYDLGGIILKWALVICHTQSLTSDYHKLRDVLVSTHAILFFGTPHSGLESITSLEVINRFASLYMKTTDVIIKDLQSHSSELANIQDLYTTASEKISSIFFCEEYVTSNTADQRDLNIPYHSATIPGDRNATTIVLHANHHNLVRFSSKEDDNYKAVQYHIKDYVNGAPAAVQEKWITENRLRDAAKGKQASLDLPLPKSRPPVLRDYIERKVIQSLITEKLLPGSVQNQPRCILHGIGGSGKTQLATRWIRDHEARFTRVIFIDASSQAQIEADLERSIRSLGPEYSKMTWADAVAYLDGKEKGWLLFLDNADLPDLNLRPYLPNSVYGSILITTRNSECISYARDGAIPVGGLEETEAINLLHKIANISPQSNTQSIEIVRELGMLALAITRAGAYIRETRRLETYLDTFRKHRDEMLDEKPDVGDEYTSSTYTAFDLSFRILPAHTQSFLDLCAFLNHSNIPISLFEESMGTGFATYTVLDDFPPPESDQVYISKLQEILGMMWNEKKFQKIVKSASRASFIDVSTDGLSYSVHPILQMYIKHHLSDDDNRLYERTTMQLVLGAIRPSEGGNARLWQLLPHVQEIPRSAQSENLVHSLAFYTLYDALGDWKACRELLESALSQVQHRHGQKHESVLFLMEQLGRVLQDCGQSDQSEKLQQEVLALRLEIVGPRHPDTITAMGNLANTLHNLGQLDKAEKMRREVLALRLEIVGPRHPATILAMNNLAGTLHALATVLAMGNLAGSLRDLGQLEEAEKIEREVLLCGWKSLDNGHPDTILAMNNLAGTLHKLGQLDEAEKLEREVLALWLDILGPRNPNTLLAMNNLAPTLHESGQLDEAEKLEREVLALWLDVRGPRDPDTILAMDHLASTLYDRDQLEEAQMLQQTALALRLEIFGRRHPGTILAIANLANTLYQCGQLDDAEKLEQAVLALRLEMLGPRHPETLDASYNLSMTLFKNNKLEEAARLLQETMELRVEVLGADHRCTVKSKELLDTIVLQQSRHSRGRFQRILSVCCTCTERST
ncbi:related to kinesin light chain [Serendipita indica DSM 11827]|uniref:Related to kinesin light chain n=1 Tax=Serendipita indica (strain DSM 11827) TaxID=1109443 RepID=G4TX94_SERID|nr:related to kinesin light chain [Serendipita indica DSM 11827]